MKHLLITCFLSSFLLVTTTSCVKECECEKPEEKTLTLQPGPENGHDCLVAYRENDGGLYASSNHKLNPDLYLGRWTFASEGAGEGTGRSYIKFIGLSEIPNDATIKSAKISLYGISSGTAAPQGNSYYTGSPYNTYGDNKAWIKRVTAEWNAETITWNNKPGTTDLNQVAIPASTSQFNYNVTDLDVTNMVKEIVVTGQNYGFCLQLQVEQIYRSLSFGRSVVADSTKRPKLVVDYVVE